MVGTSLSQQLKNYIQTMHDQGMLDYHFDHVKALQNEENPRFLMEVVSMFAHDAEAGIAHLTTLLNSAVVDFAKVISFVHQLKVEGSSSRCLQLFERMKQEYNSLKEFEMERSIIVANAVNHRNI
ncbi:hypothetical protein V6N13_077834 [Hibiscus sabdariffa]